MASTLIPVTAADSGVEIKLVLALKARASLYGHRVGPFIFDERRQLFVYKLREFSVDEWDKEGPVLMERYARQRPFLRVEVEKIARGHVAEAPAVSEAWPVPTEPVADAGIPAPTSPESASEPATPAVVPPPPSAARRRATSAESAAPTT